MGFPQEKGTRTVNISVDEATIFDFKNKHISQFKVKKGDVWILMKDKILKTTEKHFQKMTDRCIAGA